MKKTAQKNESSKEIESKKVDGEKVDDEKVEIPVDILDEKADIPAEETEELEKPSFYEKVTGEDPARHTFITEDGETTQTDSINKKLFFLGGAVFLLTILVASLIGIFILNSAKPKMVTEKTTVDEVSPTPTPTVSSINKKEWTFEILNGSGVKGAAADAREKIESLGYTVDSIGNSTNNLDTTQVFIGEGISKTDAQTVLKDLEKDFGKLSIESEDAESEASILIILGENQP